MNLATVERVLEVQHHPNADKLDIIKVLGYDAIVGRDQYKVGALVVFIQPDSILPSDKSWCQELLRYTSKGRIRAVRLRGEWSMGLVVSPYLPNTLSLLEAYEYRGPMEEGIDVTEYLGISKYEPALPGNLQAKGGLPYNIPKTDEDRWQNLRKLDDILGEPVDITLKMDGSSATYYCLLGGHWPSEDQTKVGLTSRSLELKTPDDTEQEVNSKWHEAERRYDLLRRLRDYCERENVSLALRGEITGQELNAHKNNPHAVGPTDFHLFSVYNITEKRYERKGDKYYFLNVAEQMGLPHVAVIHKDIQLSRELIKIYDSEAKAINDTPFEGVVVQHKNDSFKIINKWYDSEKE
jgi:RNA ligase (TIGR02306 family)